MATAGDTALGGDDMDQSIAQWIMEQADIGPDPDRALQLEVTVDAGFIEKLRPKKGTAAGKEASPEEPS